MAKYTFEWDTGNLGHILQDYPERDNTLEEVESVFYDPWVMIKLDRIVGEEKRFMALGEGINGTVKVVIFTFRGESIRPISCWKAKKKLKRMYYEARRKEETRD